MQETTVQNQPPKFRPFNEAAKCVRHHMTIIIIMDTPTLQASLFSTFLQTLPGLVTPHSLTQRICPTDAVGALRKVWVPIIIIMYIYHALINALSAHMIHINLNMIPIRLWKQHSVQARTQT